MEDLVILGAGGFGREVAWIVRRICDAGLASWRLIGFCDDAPAYGQGVLEGVPLLGPVERLARPVSFFCAVGKNAVRETLTRRATAMGCRAVTLVDPTAVVAPGVRIGAGSVVGIGSILSVGAVLGEGVIVNHHVCVGHDVRIGDFAQLCPGVSLSGGCEVGRGALVGTQAASIPGKRIGAGATLGPGCCAMRDVPDGAVIARIR